MINEEFYHVSKIDALPRTLDQSGTISVKLKKKLTYKSCDFRENIRPSAVICALHYLMNKNELYKSSGVQIDENWLQEINKMVGNDKYSASGSRYKANGRWPSPGANTYSVSYFGFPSSSISSRRVSMFSACRSVSLISLKVFDENWLQEINHLLAECSNTLSEQENNNEEEESDNDEIADTFNEIKDTDLHAGNMDTLLDEIEDEGNPKYDK
jgi:hypothetical protein